MNKDEILSALRADNLTNHYILPLLKLSKHRFPSEENFVNSYLDENHQTVLVQVRSLDVIIHRMMGHSNFLTALKDKEGQEYIQFSIPQKWAKDVSLFVAGKYSMFSEEAKDMIYIHSRLPLRVKETKNGPHKTDTRLMALTKNPKLQEFWREQLQVDINDDDELMFMPGERCFLKLENLRPIT
ncbi:MAG: hypothetical protein EOO02_19535 [Chitinophagaceae bacterium]|nr:MAG: hypothetical protein EOO02_19535 [Chitinophagaceae bacterium]